MPRQVADLEEALKKKGGLTLSQLANYDDVLTDALVDRVYFWSSIRKLKSTYHASRGVQEEDVCKILQRDVIINKDLAAGYKNLLQLSGIQRFQRALKTDDEKEHFERHLKKYVNIYLPDCPFEVGTTNRYTIMTAEAAIIARRPIRKGEPIKYLSGIQVEMSEREEKELSSRTDFSIVLSSRRKRPSLFLGPARFANHDCDSNARLNTSGPHGIHIVACKDIAVGDEITVVYGMNYFGEDNCECLCGSCEAAVRNGWDPRGPLLKEDSNDEEDESDDDENESDEQSGSRSREPVGALAQSRKRKRDSEEGTPATDEGSGLTRKKKLGRPRKIARVDEDTAVAQTKSRKNRLSGRRRTRGDEDIEMDDEKHDSEVLTIKKEKPDALSTYTRELSPTTLQRHPLEQVLKMLKSVASRMTDQRGKGKSAKTEETKVLEELEAEIERETRGSARKHKTNGSTADASTESPLQPSSAKSQLIRKANRLSNLRNATSADETDVDIYDVPPSPVPAAKRAESKPKRGRPSRAARDQENAEENAESTSPSPRGTENSSYESVASSATSLDQPAETQYDPWSASVIAEKIYRRSGLHRGVGNEESKVGTSSTVKEGTPNTEDSSHPRGRSTRRQTQNLRPADPVLSIEEVTKTEDENEDKGDEKRGEIRTPGDYILTRALLATPYHRWVECRNCDEHFVQGEAFLTRIACPRCERHSKLYGYYWPKTDKDNKFDREERVLDHRTIHRFLDPDDERSQRKGRKTLANAIADRERSLRESEESDVVVDKRLRISPRRSDSRRRLRMTM